MRPLEMVQTTPCLAVSSLSFSFFPHSFFPMLIDNSDSHVSMSMSKVVCLDLVIVSLPYSLFILGFELENTFWDG